MKSSPTYRMKPHYLTADKLEVGKSYVCAPNGQSYFTVLEKNETEIKIEYPKRDDEYRIQFIKFSEEHKGSFYKEKNLIKKELNTTQSLEIAKTQTMGVMISEAQKLYDNYNWGCLTPEGQQRLTYLRTEYKNIRGEEMPLEYNCPA